ncbi:FecR domain-containing protein [Pusillimonas sp.]|uniref:FecR domain-containing protein n=1 Tax=Pusillimonas sp. TaxID=3040095 RepID=UPI0029A67A3D|nr:FecR domain-containing protein [Pusillimonas sp.]MDX3895856.1 FecR domain-containing protein [Pusillimonas sp.]
MPVPPYAQEKAGSPGSHPGHSAGERPISEHIVEQAVDWYVRLASGTGSPAQRDDFKRWHDTHPDHARAWSRLQSIGGQLKGSVSYVRPDVTHATMARVGVAPGRRRALKVLMWAGMASGGLYLAQDRLPVPRLEVLLAQTRTGAGERRRLVLEDGTQLLLNTASAVDVDFNARRRRIVLLDGEIMVSTGSDPAGRPFVVDTPEGLLEPVGTRFIARHDDGAEGRPASTRLAVTEGAVRIRPAAFPADEPALIAAGQQVHFTRDQVGPPASLDEHGHAWVDGTFVAERMRLADFLAELGRYRRGHLGWAPEVADLRITGAWPLEGAEAAERILDSLERRLPVRISRYTRLWAKVVAR